jgi:site-specific DNA-methyltransferase (adenine-specific)
MRTVFAEARCALLHGDSRRLAEVVPAESLSAIVTDPPYELGFMGRAWDKSGVAFDPAFWRGLLGLLKPGGHLLAFGGSRTYHRIACAIEDAGFELRDAIQWWYGSGFPKSLDVSKAIDKRLGERGESHYTGPNYANAVFGEGMGGGRTTAPYDPATAAAAAWSGWGTALKPAYEPIIVARRPLDGTVAECVLAHGTGAINVDACRIGTSGGGASCPGGDACTHGDNTTFGATRHPPRAQEPGSIGRWPANVVLSHSPGCELVGTREGKLAVGAGADPSGVTGEGWGMRTRPLTTTTTEDVYRCVDGCPVGSLERQQEGASRFFYVAKPSSKERDWGCEGLPVRTGGEATDREDGSAGLESPRAGAGRKGGRRNFHPTTKPIALMRYLVRLVAPPGGIILDPFAGSGTTGVAVLLEGHRFLGCEMTDEYLPITEARLRRALKGE